MAIYTANSSGNLSAAATWDSQVAAVDVNTASTVSLTTGGSFTAVFTAPNTTDGATGVWVDISTAPSVNITATLYESGVATASVATIASADVTTGWVYFRLAAPYVFTTVAAGAYKWSIASVGSNSGSCYYTGSAGVIGSISTKNVTGTPGIADQIFVGAHNCTTAITVTVDGTAGDVEGGSMAFGSAGYSATSAHLTSVFIGGSSVAGTAVLKWDTAATAKLRYDSVLMVGKGGELQMGTVATPYPSGQTATLEVVGSTSGGFGIMCNSGGRVIMQGAALADYDTTYVSGSGTAASPLIVADSVDWTVNDRIVITGTSANATNYNETETRFIKTKNSANSYVLSSTAGGAEAALTYTHDTNAVVLNVERNVIVTAVTNLAQSIILNGNTSGNVNIDWAEILYLGNTIGSYAEPTVYTAQYQYGLEANGIVNMDYSVINATNTIGMLLLATTANTYTHNIFRSQGNGSSTSNRVSQLLIPSTTANQTFNDCYFLNNNKIGVLYRGANCNFTRLTCVGNAKTSQTYNTGAFHMAGSSCTITDSNFHANRPADILGLSCAAIRFNSCNLSTKGASAIGVLIDTYTANFMLFDSCNVSATAICSGYLTGAVGGTLIAFDTLNGTTNNHRWYTEYGSAQSTGSGLSDTTVRTSGTLNVRLAPEEATTGFKFEYKILAVPTKAVFALGFLERNAAFATDTCLVELFLPGSTVADASQTMATTVGTYLPFSIAATYSGTESRYATVRISAKSTTAAAYIYVADLFNGTNNITNFNTWSEGQPSSIMFEQLGDAAAVWAVPTSTLTTSGTTGEKLVDGLTEANFLALK